MWNDPELLKPCVWCNIIAKRSGQFCENSVILFELELSHKLQFPHSLLGKLTSVSEVVHSHINQTTVWKPKLWEIKYPKVRKCAGPGQALWAVEVTLAHSAGDKGSQPPWALHHLLSHKGPPSFGFYFLLLLYCSPDLVLVQAETGVPLCVSRGAERDTRGQAGWALLPCPLPEQSHACASSVCAEPFAQFKLHFQTREKPRTKTLQGFVGLVTRHG